MRGQKKAAGALIGALRHLLPILPYAIHDEERDRGRLFVETDTNDRAVEDEAHNGLIGQIALVPGLPIGPAENRRLACGAWRGLRRLDTWTPNGRTTVRLSS
jgi:hypothetical protein